jgi:hypothetical protein
MNVIRSSSFIWKEKNPIAWRKFASGAIDTTGGPAGIWVSGASRLTMASEIDTAHGGFGVSRIWDGLIKREVILIISE